MRVSNVRSLLTTTIISLALISGVANASQQTQIGTINQITGSVLIESQGEEQPITAKIGDPIHLNDTILTDEGDLAIISFIDQTSITLSGADGSLTIDEYVFDPQIPENNIAEYTALQGSFKYIGGLISKDNPNSTNINLDFGSIGIRGTTLWRTMKDHECWIFLEKGEISVSNNAGQVTLLPGDGTRIRDMNIAPAEVQPWAEEKISWIKSTVNNQAQ